MRVENHLVAAEATLEARGWRLWNRATADLISGTITDPEGDTKLQPETVLGNGSTTILGADHAGLSIFDTTEGHAKYFDGTAYRRFSRPYKSGSTWPDIALADGKIIVGNGSGIAEEVEKSAIKLNQLGAPDGDFDLGGTYTITGVPTPSDASDLANKQYVDTVATGLQLKTECEIASNLAFSATYDGATLKLTATSNGVLTATAIDSGASGVTLVAGAEGTGTRVLMKNYAGNANGIYRIADLGSGSTPAVMYRTADSDTDAELDGALTSIKSGSSAGITYQQTRDPSTFDITSTTGDVVFEVFLRSVMNTYTEGNGIDITGNVVSLYADGATTWAANKVVTTTTGNALTLKSTTKAGAVLWYNGSGLDFSPYGLPTSVSSLDIYYYNGNDTVFKPVPNRSANKVLITGAAGDPNWSSNLPTGTLIGGKTPVFDDAIIPTTRGGTGVNHGSVANGAVLYKAGGTPGTFAATTTAPVVGSVPMCTSGTTIDMVNIFARANTWTNSNTFQYSGTGLNHTIILEQSLTPTIGQNFPSPILLWKSARYDGGVVRDWWRSYVSGEFLIFTSAAAQSGTPLDGSYAVSMQIGTIANPYLAVHPANSGASITFGLTTLTGNNSSTVQFPNPGGTAAIRELANTFSAAQTISAGAGVNNLSIVRTGESYARIVADTNGTAGGRLAFGAGSGTIDTIIERTGTQVLGYSGQLAITKPAGAGGVSLGSGTLVTGTGKWQAALIEMAYGGLQVDSSGWANGQMAYKTGSGFAAVGGSPSAGKFPQHAGSSVSWSAYTLPTAIATGDLWIGTGVNTLAALAYPGADTYLLGLSSGVPAWRSTSGTTGTGTGGSGAVAGFVRMWSTLYAPSSPAANRYVDFIHGLGSRRVDPRVRRTNSDDTSSASEFVETRIDVVDSNTVRIWFSSPPTSGDYYVITVLSA